MSSVLKIIKDIWKNDRYRSLSILGFYLVFFLVIIIIAKMSPARSIKPSLESISNLEVSNEYEFEIDVKDDVIRGKYSYSYINFMFNDKSYEYSNEILLPNEFEYEEIIPFMNKEHAYQLLKDKKVYSTTKFSDDTVAKTYLVDDIEITSYDDKLTKIDVKINDLTYKIIYK